MLDVHIDQDAVRIGPRFAVSFQRTLRLPDDGRVFPLPPGLGRFPVLRVEDYLESVPTAWREHGGVFIPMYQREALWLGFHGAVWKPNAVKVSAGGVNVVSGEPDEETLHDEPQNYLVCPGQPWLDGIHTGHEMIRQFVAMPLGLGYTVEASMTGTETVGGIQITVYEPKPGRFPDEPPLKRDTGPVRFAMPKPGGATSMGLSAGGAMKQKIYPDPYGIETWDRDNCGKIFIHIVNSTEFSAITGFDPPPTPIDAKTYTEYGLPWFELYDETEGDVPASERLSKAKTISARDAERGESDQADASFEVTEAQRKKMPTGDRQTQDDQSSKLNPAASSSRRE
jgi:hypothetical protein